MRKGSTKNSCPLRFIMASNKNGGSKSGLNYRWPEISKAMRPRIKELMTKQRLCLFWQATSKGQGASTLLIKKNCKWINKWMNRVKSLKRKWKSRLTLPKMNYLTQKLIAWWRRRRMRRQIAQWRRGRGWELVSFYSSSKMRQEKNLSKQNSRARESYLRASSDDGQVTLRIVYY